MTRPARENLIQAVGLVLILTCGFLIRGWAGALTGFALFAIAIALRVRHKMARAQKIGKANRAARDAAINKANARDALTTAV